jgi:hypothetical protein
MENEVWENKQMIDGARCEAALKMFVGNEERKASKVGVDKNFIPKPLRYWNRLKSC